MYDVILFDFDGTVFDTVEGVTKSVRYALNKFGRDAELSQLRRFVGPPLRDSFMDFCGLDAESAEGYVAAYRERYNTVGLYECRVYPGMKELLTALRGAGKRIGIATSKPRELAETLLEREGMLPLFDAVCGADNQGRRNAKWQMVEDAMAALGARAEETVLVGDTKYDVAGAHQVGIPCIGVRYGCAAPGELEAAQADALAADCGELKSLLLGA